MLRIALLVLVGLGFLPAAAQAVTPLPSTYVMHDHRTRGDGWHIELTVASDLRFLRQVVLHSERCDETVLTTRVRIREGATIASAKPFTTTDGARGTWRLDARWIARNQIMGTFHVATPTCDGGVRRFSAAYGGHEHDDGHENHDHGGHVAFGTPIGSYPDLQAGSDAVRARLEALRVDSLKAAAERFPTYEKAIAAGFRSKKDDWTPPVVFHVRHPGYARDGRALDPRRPESLVYSWTPDGAPVLVAFMYRMPTSGGWPGFGRPLLGWHAHARDGKTGATVMTHVWMTGDLRSAIANCMPVPALEAANAAFRFQPSNYFLSQESVPCLDDMP